jgi:hypothetical protein
LSGKYAIPLEFEVQQSRLLGGWLLLTHTSALLLLPLLPLSGWLLLPPAVAVLCSLMHGWRLHVERSHPQAVQALHWAGGRRCRLTLTGDREIEAVLVPQAVVLPWLTILRFSGPARRRRFLVLLPDMLDRDRFRQLRVRLKIELNQLDD